MTPIQQLMLGTGSKNKVFLDDVFSNYLYTGTGSERSINNGVDLAGEGGLVWIKNRDASVDNNFYDTERGAGTYISSNTNDVEDTSGTRLSAFNNNGFTLQTNGAVNDSGTDFASWSFRKAPGFFDIVTYTGNAQTNRVVTHNLGSVPGCIMIKKTSGSLEDWRVYHRGTDPENPGDYFLRLNQNYDRNDTPTFMDTIPTSTQFLVNSYSDVNANGETYVAYLFAGGESTAATARSVDFDGTGDYLLSGSSSDFTMGTGDFTVEGWFKPDAINNVQLQISDDSDGLKAISTNCIQLSISASGYWVFVAGANEKTTSAKAEIGQWQHIAYVRNSGTTSLYVNGVLADSGADTFNYNGTYLAVGGGYSSSWLFNGKISNFRVVKGTAVYTSSFRPPTEPLTSISGTGLLCCNNSSVTGTTTGSVSSNGDPTASTDSPFDDPAGFVFGESGSENVIKTGSYVGSGSAGLEVNVGFEPQWIMFKNASATYNWYVLDVMRGIVSGGDDRILAANTTSAEWDSSYIDVTPTGFKLQTSHALANGSGNTYIYMCLRRPDGYVGKPRTATELFAMDTGNSSSTIPAFDSGFPVDFGIKKSPASTGDWLTTTRLTGLQVLKTNSNAAESTSTTFTYDSNVGYAKSQDAVDQGWMWKRHAGFDVVCYEGTQTVQDIKHSLNKAPEMMWIKNRDSSTYNWSVYHSGLGDNRFKLYLNTNDSYSNDQAAWNNTAPTSTHFTLGTDATANHSGSSYIAMLFASTDVSKVGSYTGNGSTTGPVITTGFSPRLIMIKRTDDSGGWFLYDTLRGITSGNDHRIQLEENSGQSSGADDVDVLSTGFQLKHTWNNLNGSGGNYIYYAHA